MFFLKSGENKKYKYYPGVAYKVGLYNTPGTLCKTCLLYHYIYYPTKGFIGMSNFFIFLRN